MTGKQIFNYFCLDKMTISLTDCDRVFYTKPLVIHLDGALFVHLLKIGRYVIIKP